MKKSIRRLTFIIAINSLLFACVTKIGEHSNKGMDNKNQVLLTLSQKYCETYQNVQQKKEHLSSLSAYDIDMFYENSLYVGQNIESVKILLGSGITKEERKADRILLYVEDEGWVFSFSIDGELLKYVEQ